MRGPIDMWLVNVIPFGHHSNGQNGCLFIGQTRVAGECEPRKAGGDGPEDINVENGSFSTNYLRFGLEYRRLRPDGDDPVDTRAVTRREWGIGGSVELNPSGYVGGSISDRSAAIRPTRFRVAADVASGNWRAPIPLLNRVNCGRAWAEGSLMFIRDAAPLSTGDDAVEAACLPSGWGGAGLFVRVLSRPGLLQRLVPGEHQPRAIRMTFLQAKFLAFARR